MGTHKVQPPWADGPCELLRHGLELLRKDTDKNRRLAMISIDNAVELMIRTYLGLPERINGLKITRKQFAEIGDSFPAMLDALEAHAATKIVGIDLGSVEWHHRLRNQLYHHGNGLTIERSKVELYAEIANQLFKNLFGFELIVEPIGENDLLGEFIGLWTKLERGIWFAAVSNNVGSEKQRGPVLDNIRLLFEAGRISSAQANELHALRKLRNGVLHGGIDLSVITPDVVASLRALASHFPVE